MSTFHYTLGDALRLTLALEPSRFPLAPGDLFALAMRQNPRRPFLFVSKVLGKHLPIRPAALLAAGRLLALAWTGARGGDRWADLAAGRSNPPFSEVLARLEEEQIPLGPGERTLFVGFAETATGLARAAAGCFRGEAAYLSTTRLSLPGSVPLSFDESHSHARTHLLYLDPRHPFLQNCGQAVLIDDELTTGHTALQLVRLLHQTCGISRFWLLSLLDNSREAPRRALAQELGIALTSLSLLRGEILSVEDGRGPEGNRPSGTPLPELEDWRGTSGRSPAVFCAPDCLRSTGRTLMTVEDQAASLDLCRAAARRLGEDRSDTLFLGSGELIYEPAVIAGLCNAQAFQSTTQSPIYPLAGSAVTCGVRFDPPDCYSSAGYLYNVPEGRFRRAVIVAERKTQSAQGLEQLAAYLYRRGIWPVEEVLL